MNNECEVKTGKGNTLRLWAARLAIALGALQIVLILVSWLIAAAWPESNVRSLLSSEGIRWFFAHFTDNLLTSLLVWILLLSMAIGALHESRLWQATLRLLNISHDDKPLKFRQMLALRVVGMEVAIYIIIMCLLTMVPHAVLLSVTGELFPSSFSASIVPTICFMLCLCSATYGYMAGELTSLKDIVQAMTVGIGQIGEVWLLYIFGVQLYFSLCFVFFAP